MMELPLSASVHIDKIEYKQFKGTAIIGDLIVHPLTGHVGVCEAIIHNMAYIRCLVCKDIILHNKFNCRRLKMIASPEQRN